MSQIFRFICVSIILSRNILVQSIQEGNFKQFESNFTEHEVKLSSRLKNITSKNSTSWRQHHEYLSDRQDFVDALITGLKSATNSTKVDITDDGENIGHYATQSILSRDRTRHKRQVTKDDEVETDETIRMTFNEKERNDGFKRTRAQDYPYAVQIATYEPNQKSPGHCSGTLVTTRAVLTAAHCLENGVDKVRVCAGGDSFMDLENHSRLPKGAQLRETRLLYSHPEYDPDPDKLVPDFDIAVVKVSKEFKLTSTVQTLKIGAREWSHEGYKACMFTGFGTVYADKDDPADLTRKTHYLEVKRPCPCSDPAQPALCNKPREDYGLCGGDSGGGVVCDGLVVAVLSYGVEYLDIDNCTFKDDNNSHPVGCGLKNSQNFFTETGPYLDWINSKVNRASSDRSCHLVLAVTLVTTLYYIQSKLYGD